VRFEAKLAESRRGSRLMASRFLFLLGFMGAGKTTIGEPLAERLGWGFTDLDDEIEQAAGRTIAEIFSEEGEVAFRDRESVVLSALPESGEWVVATGGGIVTRRMNVERMQSLGRTYWIDPPFEVLAERVDRAGSATRPLFADRATARALWDERRPLYGAADQRIAVALEETVDHVIERIVRHHRAEVTCGS